MEREFNFNAKQLHKDSEYHYNLNMAEKYNNLLTLMREQVEKGEYELTLPARDLTTEVMYWLHDDLGFNFDYIPRAQSLESNNWKTVSLSPDLDHYEWVKIRW